MSLETTTEQFGSSLPIAGMILGKSIILRTNSQGYYCDIILPMKRTETYFEITDLFLDLWVSPDGSYQVEDEDEFESAITHNWIQADLANQARNALQGLDCRD